MMSLPRLSVQRRSSFLAITALVALLAVVMAVGSAVASGHVQDINPDVSDNSNANASTGGRVNGLAADPNSNQTFYAASEYGGLFKSTNAGLSWTRLDNHLPVVTWDVAVDPSNSNRVYATSWYDGRVNPLSGINVSTNGGSTWTRPATSQPNTVAQEGTGADNTPQAGYVCNEPRRSELYAFGIGIRPDAPQNVFIGTSCGLAVSADSGATWQFVDPNSSPGVSGDVWDVVVQAGGPSGQGIVDICGDSGHFRSTNGGTTWTGGAAAIPGGRCSIAASPDESYVLFIVASDNNVYESDDAGATWTNLGNQGAQGRIPFVVTNQRSDDGGDRFDLWYSDTQLFQVPCTTPAAPAMGGAARCPNSASGSWSNEQTGAHWDAGDLEFDTATSVDACPAVYSTDGGAHVNALFIFPVPLLDCQDPLWSRSNVGLHALWLWSFDGANQAGNASEDLYMGAQDNGTFATTNAGAVSPTWTNPLCCDTFDMLADSSWVLGTNCCFNTGRFNRLQLASPGYAGNAEINTYPAGNIPGFTFGSRLAQFSSTGVALITSSDLFITNDITANPIAWTGLGAPANLCNVQVGVTGGSPTFFVQDGQCTGAGNDQVFSYTGTAPGGAWTRIDNNDGLTGGFGVFAVDPNNPNRLYASNLAPAGPQMVFSTDGGATWDNDPELDALMTGNGVFKYQNQRGPKTNRGGAGARFTGYPQPSLLAFDPEDSNIVIAGGIDSGIFFSGTGGQNWTLVTDPFTGNVHVPRPRFAYFDHEPAGTVNVYIGTQGRGAWRITLERPVADAGGPYVTNEGTDVVLDGSGSVDPNGDPLTYEWDLDNDGAFDDAVGATPTFDRVGQDGVFTVRLRVTDPGGLSDIDETTVTVNNVAPSVSLATDAPKDEGSVVTVSGVVSDPGWLDALTATIDWKDGSGVQPIAGVLENVRPDATLTFDAAHVYGDNGLYNVEVCGSDDDTTTCETIAVQIDNVAPTVTIDAGQITVIQEGDTVTVLAHFSDPGWLDTYTSVIDWGTGESDPGTLLVTTEGFESPDIGTVTGSHQYGDNGVFTITVSVTDDDLGVGSAQFDLTVTNVDPTAEIDETGTVLVNGTPTFIAHVGDPLDFTGYSTDPGSDDITLRWDWDDGAPAPDVTTVYLVNPPALDPLPSPSVQPRDLTDMQTHTFDYACLFVIKFLADDDDGGHGEDDANVIIVGNADRARSAGYWLHQYRGNGKIDFTQQELECYLKIAGYMSQVFNETRDASTIEKAYDVLFVNLNKGTKAELLDRQLLAAWLNFANGAVEYDEPLDVTGDGIADGTFAEIMAAAEAVRLDPTATDAQIEEQKDRIERINLMDE